MSKTARFLHCKIEKSRREQIPIYFILAGVSAKGDLGIFWYEYPNFYVNKLEDGFVVKGSGSYIAKQIANRKTEFYDKNLDLKSRTDILVRIIEHEIGSDLDQIHITSRCKPTCPGS